MQIRRQMTGIYHPCSTFTSQSAHFCDIFSKCKFEQIHFIAAVPWYQISVSCSDWSNVFMLTDSRCCWQYRALSISRSYNSGKDFLKHGFGACNTNFFARLFAYPSAPRRAKNMPVIKEKEAFKIWSFSYTPLWQSAVTFTKRLTYKRTFKRYSIVTTPKEANTWSIYLFKLATMLLHMWKKQYF